MLCEKVLVQSYKAALKGAWDIVQTVDRAMYPAFAVESESAIVASFFLLKLKSPTLVCNWW